MKTFSRQERAEIYLQATDNLNWGCCWAIQDIIEPHSSILKTATILKAFPEFALFQPDDAKPDKFWFPVFSDEGENCRVLALLFAHQIALNP